MESTTYLKNIKVSPKKMRFILDAVKKMSPIVAAEHLNYRSGRVANIFYKSIMSAISNAKNTLKISENLLKFKVLTIEEGPKLKRFNPGSRGTAKPYMKRFSHIKMVIVEDEKNSVLEKKQISEVEKVKEVKVKKDESKIEVVKKEVSRKSSVSKSSPKAKKTK
ncbi:MAG: uL22 family ribosomal protein [Candidatus Roizmanbacteria bacterium]